MRVLIVKLSSMGDLVQALPAVTDASKALPGIRFDWAVDEAFAEVPAWHPAVATVIPTAHRRWRKQPLRYLANGELAAFLRQLRQRRYDRVIDAQTNIKSAVVTALAKGEKVGPDKASVRERGAQLAYHQRLPIAKNQHAVQRLRQLFAGALDYALPATAPDFGIPLDQFPKPDCGDRPYLVCVTNASWTTKRWPDAYWDSLFELAGHAGYRVLLPWGSPAEREHARRLAASHDHCEVLPHQTLTALAGLFRGAAGAVCNDTGLAHIAASLGTPTVTVYGPTDPGLIAATGPRSSHLASEGYDCIPCYRRQCSVAGYSGPDGQCLRTVSTEAAWQALQAMQATTLQGA